jgi:hypothetical protein
VQLPDRDLTIMSWIIADTLTGLAPDGTARALTRRQIDARPSIVPLFVRVPAGGTWYEMQGDTISVTTDAAGAFLLTLPLPADTLPSAGLQWTLAFPDGTALTGSPPAGSGTFTAYQLVTLLGWSASDTTAGPAPLTIPAASLIQLQAVFPGYAGASDTVSTTQNADGSITTVYAAMGLTVHSVFGAGGVITQTYTGPFSHTATITPGIGAITEVIT